MANESNLKPVRTKNEARERGRNGGLKSGEVRAKRKTLKDELIALLSTKVDGKTMQENISLSLIQEAMSGDTKAFLAIRDTIGEKPKEEIELSQSTAEVTDEIDKYIKEKMVNND